MCSVHKVPVLRGVTIVIVLKGKFGVTRRSHSFAGAGGITRAEKFASIVCQWNFVVDGSRHSRASNVQRLPSISRTIRIYTRHSNAVNLKIVQIVLDYCDKRTKLILFSYTNSLNNFRFCSFTSLQIRTWRSFQLRYTTLIVNFLCLVVERQRRDLHFKSRFSLDAPFQTVWLIDILHRGSS